jgi:hypothetical protein
VGTANSLAWFELAWSFRPRIKSELSLLLNLRLWLRVLAVAMAIIAVLACSLLRAIPDLEFNWVRAFLLSVGGLALGLCLLFALLWLVPPQIRINRKGILRQQGQSVHWRLRADIRRIIVDLANSKRPVLRVENSRKPFEAGIPAKVAPDELLRFLQRMFPELVVEERR